MKKYRFLLLVIVLAISSVAVSAIVAGKEKVSEPAVGQKNPLSSVLMASIGSSNYAIAARDCYQCCGDKISLKTDLDSQGNDTNCCYDDCGECTRSLFGDYPCGYVYRLCTTVSELE